MNNPTRIGIELGKVVYTLSVENEQISTVTGNNVVINPKSVNSVTFQGNLTLNPNLLTRLVNLANPPLIVAQGVSVAPPKATGEVVWLSETVKEFTLTAPFSLSLLSPKNGPAPPAGPGAPAAPAA